MQIWRKLGANAGTLNPHQPKRVGGASQIERWADPGLGALNLQVAPPPVSQNASRDPVGRDLQLRRNLLEAARLLELQTLRVTSIARRLFVAKAVGVPGIVSNLWPRLRHVRWKPQSTRIGIIGERTIGQGALLDDLAGIHHRSTRSQIFAGNPDFLGDKSPYLPNSRWQFGGAHSRIWIWHVAVERGGRSSASSNLGLPTAPARSSRAGRMPPLISVLIGFEPSFRGGNPHYFEHFERSAPSRPLRSCLRGASLFPHPAGRCVRN